MKKENIIRYFAPMPIGLLASGLILLFDFGSQLVSWVTLLVYIIALPIFSLFYAKYVMRYTEKTFRVAFYNAFSIALGAFLPLIKNGLFGFFVPFVWLFILTLLFAFIFRENKLVREKRGGFGALKTVSYSVLIFPCAFVMLFVVLIYVCVFPHKYEFSQRLVSYEGVTIEIVEIKEAISLHGKDVLKSSYCEEKIEKIATVSDNESFIKNLQRIKCIHRFGPPSEVISGKAVRIIYPDGSIELISDSSNAVVIGVDVHIDDIVFNEKEFNTLLDEWR